MWVVVKIRVPFWVPIRVRHLIFALRLRFTDFGFGVEVLLAFTPDSKANLLVVGFVVLSRWSLDVESLTRASTRKPKTCKL